MYDIIIYRANFLKYSMAETADQLANVLWLCLYTEDGNIAVVGIFSSEEKALAAIPDNDDGEYWICPTDIDVVVSSEEDRFNELPDRVYRAYVVEQEVSPDFEPDEQIDKPTLRVIE